MRTDTNRAAPPVKTDDTAPCDDIVVPGRITVKPRSLGRTVVDDFGEALGKLEEGVNGRGRKPPLPGSRLKDQREWYWNNICMGGCDHYRPDCLESDRLADCMKNMDARLRREMDEAVPRFRTRQEYEEYRADVMHASGEEVRR